MLGLRVRLSGCCRAPSSWCCITHRLFSWHRQTHCSNLWHFNTWGDSIWAGSVVNFFLVPEVFEWQLFKAEPRAGLSAWGLQFVPTSAALLFHHKSHPRHPRKACAWALGNGRPWRPKEEAALYYPGLGPIWASILMWAGLKKNLQLEMLVTYLSFPI